MHHMIDERNHAERRAYVAGLHQLADFLDAHPEVPQPYSHSHITGLPSMYIYLHGDDPRAQLAAITRALASTGRTVHKDATDDRMRVWADLGGLALVAQADRGEVCERVVVGTETVEVEEDACPECGGALTVIIDETQCAADKMHYRARKPGKRTAAVEREIVRWECSPLLADTTEEAQS